MTLLNIRYYRFQNPGPDTDAPEGFCGSSRSLKANAGIHTHWAAIAVFNIPLSIVFSNPTILRCALYETESVVKRVTRTLD